MVVTSWVVALLFFNSRMMNVVTAYHLIDESLSSRGPGYFEPIVISVALSLTMVFSIASLMWKKWGFVGLGAITLMPVVASVVLFLSSEFDINSVRYVLIAHAIFAIVLVVLVRPIWKQLSWK